MDQFVTRLIDAGGPATETGFRSRYRAVRARTEAYCADLSPEDRVIQSMPDASPAKWHLAHTTWFFEQFLCKPNLPGYAVFDDDFHYLFNSYYEQLGPRHARTARGLITRPSAGDVAAYRAHVDAAVETLLAQDDPAHESALRLGFAHEEQHQELLLTDVMHAFAQNPLAWGRRPIAVLPGWTEPVQDGPSRMVAFPGGIVAIGDDEAPFSFDNEGPRHDVLLRAYALDAALVTNAAWRAFIDDGGYTRPGLWMSDGWARAQEEGWNSPLYWRQTDDGWVQFGLGGVTPLDDTAPVRHVSWYEADAFARWAGKRLPTEHEIEAASATLPGLFGHVWQWTASPYVAYPGYRPPPGAIGEYNGKFMINQMVLRGSAHTTSPEHSRPTYRNFFHPEKRWQVTGLRLAEDR